MERLRLKLGTARKALITLQELLVTDTVSTVERDAAIQRFDSTFEAVWKTARHFLRHIEGIEIASPKGVVRSSFEVGLLSEEEARRALTMVDDRNLTSHTYNEGVAEKIYSQLQYYALILDTWLKAMDKGVEKSIKQ